MKITFLLAVFFSLFALANNDPAETLHSLKLKSIDACITRLIISDCQEANSNLLNFVFSQPSGNLNLDSFLVAAKRNCTSNANSLPCLEANNKVLSLVFSE